MEYETNNYNPRVSMSYDGVSHNVTSAPPLFPRLHNSNYEKGLPTVQVRPLPIHERISSSSVGGGSRSPSLAGSNRCRIRWIMESGSIKNSGSDRCIASCDEMEPLAGNEALRRYGEIIMGDDDGGASCSSSQLQPAATDRCRQSSGLKYKVRMRRSTNNRTSGETPTREDWRTQCKKRISGACDAAAELRGERLKSNPAIDRNITSDSLSNVEEDDDYMTMRPVHRRVITQNSESQRRPLLETSDSDGLGSSDFLYPDELKSSQRRKPPPPPAHNIKQKNSKAIAGHRVASNRVYDEPAIDATNVDKKSSKLLKESQSTSELPHSLEKLEEFSNIDDGDNDRTANTSTSSNVHQTMAIL
ncbi:unnamed protein product [Litomosoides sigmodontis]|uniref:Uncharacterized protein n=1 Tax=Litomosoides sigmodontis TaxID=42156 RepID=A0A3P6TUR8_LITSI|nr:unnamed protein product [Litomosoides sigmodontis]